MPLVLPYLWALVLVLIPLLLIALAKIFPLLDKIGIVVLAFASGLLFSVFYQPDSVLTAQALSAVKMQVAEICIALAIPLLLFSVHIPASLKLAGNAVKAMLLACLSVCVASLVASFLFHAQVDQVWDAAGMMVGSYTGGGQNIGAVKAAINADETLFIDILTYDIVISSLFLLSAMTILKPIFRHFLRPFQVPDNEIELHEDFVHMTDDSAAAFTQLLRPAIVPSLALMFVLAAACVGLSLLFSQPFPAEMQSAVIIISLTTLGAALSFIPRVRSIKSSYRLGMLLIVIFCFVSGSMADSNLAAHLKPDLFMYIGATLVLSVGLHALLCKLFRIDVDTFVITATAAVMSVPFIPMVTSSLKNKALLFPGIAAAVVGYIIGNYLGIIMTLIVKVAVQG